jgi:hypothetical protein
VLHGADFSNFQRLHHLDNFRARFPLPLGHGTSADVERRPATRVPQQFLGHLDAHAKRSQICRERVAEAMPADLLVHDARPDWRRPNTLLRHAVRTKRFAVRSLADSICFTRSSGRRCNCPGECRTTSRQAKFTVQI